MKTNVIAHRGAKLEAPENTMPAFELSVDAGANMIELDVRLTKDGVPVVIHDETIDRTTDGKGKVTQWVWSDLQQVPVKAENGGSPNVRIPRLKDVLEFAKNNIGLNIEIKDPSTDLCSRLIDLIDATLFPLSDLIISSFDFDVLRRIGQQRPDIQLGSLFSRVPSNIRDLPGSWVHPHFACVDPHTLSLFSQADRKVNVWTVNEPMKQKELVDLKVDGIITDDPRALVDLLRTLRRR